MSSMTCMPIIQHFYHMRFQYPIQSGAETAIDILTFYEIIKIQVKRVYVGHEEPKKICIQPTLMKINRVGNGDEKWTNLTKK